jgi:hypothetical protein
MNLIDGFLQQGRDRLTNTLMNDDFVVVWIDSKRLKITYA